MRQLRLVVARSMFRISGSLVVDSAVVLRGSYDFVPSHAMAMGASFPNDGSVLMPTGGRGNESATPFITVLADGAVRGFCVWHVEQESTALPVAYPWALSLVGNNAAVADVELLNPFNGISAVKAPRHYIARVQGQPLNIGVFIDSTYDIGRVEDVHFNPWYSCKHPFVEYQLTVGRAFVIGRSDWEYVFNTFAFGYSVGYHFIETETGTMNGNLVGIGADLATKASVLVDGAQPPGLLITNGEFTAFTTPDWCPHCHFNSTQVLVAPSNTGAVKFVDSSFWGPCSQIAMLEGTGSVTFSSCEFVQWDLQNPGGKAAIQAEGGALVLQGNDFLYDGRQVYLGANVSKAVITGNLIKGTERIVMEETKKSYLIGLNAPDDL